jgi:hypothetical protein
VLIAHELGLAPHLFAAVVHVRTPNEHAAAPANESAFSGGSIERSSMSPSVATACWAVSTPRRASDFDQAPSLSSTAPWQASDFDQTHCVSRFTSRTASDFDQTHSVSPSTPRQASDFDQTTSVSLSTLRHPRLLSNTGFRHEPAAVAILASLGERVRCNGLFAGALRDGYAVNPVP